MIKAVLDIIMNVFIFCLGMVAIAIVLCVAIPYAILHNIFSSTKAVCWLAREMFVATVEVAFGAVSNGVKLNGQMNDNDEP